ncbi:MAG: hypothetical protein H8E79_09040 [Desulfobulbaceae bacterium]|uniref:Uncharacterized protein n=1 Tax=Candidatus Desulfatifera sulfidica TaxID=2841691 RepID=A0A8J6N9K2_9BACT|nr:hypothetical protein [Candidatus Desulfatifera sulfidica]
MRQFVIDDLSPMERDNIDSYLKRSLKPGPMLGLYWIVIPPDLYSEKQQGHDDCGPFYLGVEVSKEAVCFELLVRSESNLHCDCIAHASAAQRQYVLDFIDRMVEEEMIRS